MYPCPSPNGTNFERLFIVRKPDRMAMDADPFSGPTQTPQFNNGGDPDGPDLRDKIYELLTGKLDDADIAALLELIQGTAPQAQPIAGDRRRGMATDELLRSRVSTGLARQARSTSAGLIARFPALKNARVVG